MNQVVRDAIEHDRKLRTARRERARLTAIVNGPMRNDAMTGDADARRALDEAAEQLKTVELQLAALEADEAAA